jgi:hypothetical protein
LWQKKTREDEEERESAAKKGIRRFQITGAYIVHNRKEKENVS